MMFNQFNDKQRVSQSIQFESEFYSNSEILPALTAHKIRDILLVSSLYNIFNMEEGGILASQIVNEYKGLKLENPPRITGVSSTEDALGQLSMKEFDMVLIVPNLERMDPFSLGCEIKKIRPKIPVILLSQNMREISTLLKNRQREHIDQIHRWYGNPDLLLAIVKNTEDHLNVGPDTQRANVRVVVLVEDSPEYYSYLLPILYKEIVNQTQALLEVGLTEKQRSMTLRARPKILLAKTYEEGLLLCRQYRSYLFCLISDTRLPRKGAIDADAGIRLLTIVRRENPGIPLLLMSTEETNRERAVKNSFMFIDKNSPNIQKRIHEFFLEQLGFGDFIFRRANGEAIGRAVNFLTLEKKLYEAPDESIAYHAERHHFSRWIMARSEISLALTFRSFNIGDFKDIEELRAFLVTNINTLRKYRQKGVVSRYNKHHFDVEVREFVKYGEGTLGGKARGLAFMYDLFRQHEDLQKKHPKIRIRIPKTLVICTELFDEFVGGNNLRPLLRMDLDDESVTEHFLNARMPERLVSNLKSYLKQVRYPLSVRSSSLMEDAHYQPYAGLYRTYKIPNNDPELSVRVAQLIKAIKLVYASTYFEGPRSYSKSTSNQHGKESMAVIIQQMTGQPYGDHFYPTLSGIAQSHNYYPFGKMKAEEGIVYMALGLGKTVVGGEKCIRFSPRHPAHIPDFSLVDDMLKNAQQTFYSLKISNYPVELNFERHSNLEKRHISEALTEFPVQTLCSTYIPDEHRIRDTFDLEGPKVLTFARVLKYGLGGIPEMLVDLLELGKKGFGCPVEIEFSVNLPSDPEQRADLYFLQIRPMFTSDRNRSVEIAKADLERAFCLSSRALGNGINREMIDLVYIKPEAFKTEATRQIAGEIADINARLEKENRTYLLAGPGRWGGSDRWLGIPVKWHQISRVGAIVELRNEKLSADLSQGSHFFHNITSLGIHYIMLDELESQGIEYREDFFDWGWADAQPALSETEFVRHVRLETPMTLKIDGRNSRCVIMKP